MNAPPVLRRTAGMMFSKIGVAALSLAMVAGCGDEKKPTPVDAGVSDAGNKPAPGGKLGEALRDLASANASASSEPGGGPPPTGIFEPGAADKEVPPNTPPTLKVIDDGVPPRVSVQPADASKEEKLPFVLVLALGGKSILPPLIIDLTVGPEKIEGTKEKGDKGDKPAASASAAVEPAKGPPRVVATVGAVNLAEGAKEAPKELTDALGKLKGSTISFVLTKTGPVDVQRKLAKDAEKQLDLHLRAIAEGLSGLYVAAPDKPVGVGGYWMVTDRHQSMGVEVIRYRVFKVTKVEGNNASVSLDVRQYAVNDKIDIPELGPQLQGLSLGRYQTQGKAVLDLEPGHVFPPAAAFKLEEQLGVGPGGQKGLPIQIVTQIGTTPPKGLQDAQQQGQPGGGGVEDEPPVGN